MERYRGGGGKEKREIIGGSAKPNSGKGGSSDRARSLEGDKSLFRNGKLVKSRREGGNGGFLSEKRGVRNISFWEGKPWNVLSGKEKGGKKGLLKRRKKGKSEQVEVGNDLIPTGKVPT